MTGSPIFGFPEVAPNQTQKETTINNALAWLEGALADTLVVAFVSNGLALTSDDFTRHLSFSTSGAQAASTLTIPAIKKLFVVDNSTGTYAITVTVGLASPPVVVAGALALLYCDGTNVKLVSSGAAPSGGTTSPGGTTGGTGPAPAGALLEVQTISRPAYGDFTWLNQGRATAVDHANGPLTLTLEAHTGGDNVQGLLRPVPSGSTWTVTAYFDLMTLRASFYNGALLLYDQGSGRIILFAINLTVTDILYQVSKWSSPSAFVSQSKTDSVLPRDRHWLRIYCDGTNLNYQLSGNGVDWLTFLQEPISTFFTAITHVGIGGSNNLVASTAAASNASAFPGQINVFGFESVPGVGTSTTWSPAALSTVPVVFVFPGKPAAGQIITIPLAVALTLPANLVDSISYSDTLFTAAAAFPLYLITAAGATKTLVATATVGTSGKTAVTFSQQALISAPKGSALQFAAPATQDATGADVTITLLASRA